MSSNSISIKIDPERVKEMPMVDLAFEVLKSANTPYYYRDLMMEIAKIRGLTEDDIKQFIAQVYTEINIDGRFACVGGNVWGLKRWYPVEKSEDPVGNAKRTRIINDEDDIEDEDYSEEEFEAEEEYEDFEAEDYEESDEDSEVDDVDLEEEIDEVDEEIEEEEDEEEEYEDEEEEDTP